MGHNHGNQSGKNLRTAFLLNIGFTIFEIFGGLYVNSVAIISDAVHDLGDSISLGISWYLDKKSKQEGNKQFSFGFKRFSLLGALINSLVLIGGSVYVIYEAIQRLIEPELSDANGMIVFGIIGVAVNGYAAWKMSSGKTLNEKVVSWHLLEDVLGWAAVLIVAIVLKFYESPYLDPALSLFITAYILFNVVKRLKETLTIFLQGVPDDISIDKIEEELIQIKNVDSIHHTHIWSQEGEHHVFSTHLKLKHISDLAQLLTVKTEIKNKLKPYHFEHCTVETELDKETCGLD
ncbi:cation diffusion facilitator family transporter [Acidiluteibacter ferrifornacis]|uniref:Cation diffusion facilitator family transporter n=2 Tax=Acidiluteibacter ferrifornacis TaxID=2692424 RepID=A0A6N9NGF4_9FLAO|nr:cation diffusion facilitator family transporter [Acidiluteibacter ferrifornacis]NBG65718.1 cation diffusion facilitator family transporter [Acidiluteibacter ferrifornacis]